MEAMTMLSEVKFTAARNGFTGVIDKVQNLTPVVISPRKQSEKPTFLFHETHVHELLAGYKFKLETIPEEDGSITLAMDQLELYSNGETVDEAVDALVEDIVMYANEYLDNPVRYHHAPNRRQHLPYILKIMVCNNTDEVKRLLLEDAEI
jgi:antitoxin YefM